MRNLPAPQSRRFRRRRCAGWPTHALPDNCPGAPRPQRHSQELPTHLQACPLGRISRTSSGSSNPGPVPRGSRGRRGHHGVYHAGIYWIGGGGAHRQGRWVDRSRSPPKTDASECCGRDRGGGVMITTRRSGCSRRGSPPQRTGARMLIEPLKSRPVIPTRSTKTRDLPGPLRDDGRDAQRLVVVYAGQGIIYVPEGR